MYLKDHNHTVFNPKLPDDDFDEAVEHGPHCWRWGRWSKRILRELGMKEDEPIKSRMVSRRIATALKKIAKSATGDVPANSAEEWLERNCR